MVCRKMMMMLMKTLGMSDQSYTLGRDRDEILNIVDYALGKIPDFPKPDIILMDENFDYGGCGMLYGTRFANLLKKNGFEGIIVIMSANSSR